MGLQIRQKLSSLVPILVKPSVFAYDAPSPTASSARSRRQCCGTARRSNNDTG